VNPPSITFAEVAGMLLPGTFALTGGRDKHGAAIIEYRPKMHEKRAHLPMDTLKLALYLMEKASLSAETNRHGITLLRCSRDFRVRASLFFLFFFFFNLI
jgi:hypothetical protein